MLWHNAFGVAIRMAMSIVAPPATTHAGSQAASATVVFGGDVVPHRDLLRSFEQHGADSLLAPVAPVLRAADLALVNFETPAAPSRPVARVGFHFNVHGDFAHALVDSGIDGASVANNHSYDMGIRAVGETVVTLQREGLRPIGGALPHEDPLAPQEFQLAGATLCVFAATRLLNLSVTQLPEQPRVGLARHYPHSEEQRLLEAVRRYRPHCGAIIVSLHTGIEYQDQPLPVDRAYFHAVADAGADAVIGHHSHTPHPVEVYESNGRRVPLFYSLGNLVSNQGYRADSGLDARPHGRWDVGLEPRTREGLLAVLRFESDGNGGLRLASSGYVPLWTVNTHMQVGRREAPQISAALMPREGGDDTLLRRRWEALVRRVGRGQLLAPDQVPGATQGYRLSDAAVLANRRGTPVLTASSGRRGGSSPARAPQ